MDIPDVRESVISDSPVVYGCVTEVVFIDAIVRLGVTGINKGISDAFCVESAMKEDSVVCLAW